MTITLDKLVGGGLAYSGGQIIQAGGFIQPVATRCGTNGASGPSTSFPSSMSRSRHILPYGALDVRAVYAPFQVPGGAESALSSLGQGVFSVASAVASGGTGAAVGDRFTLPVGTRNVAAAIFRTAQVNAGNPSQLSPLAGGAYYNPPANGITHASTSGAGTGETFTFTFNTADVMINLGLERVWGTQTAANIIAFQKGSNWDGTPNNTMLIQNGRPLITDPIEGNWTAGSAIGLRLWTDGCPTGASRPVAAAYDYANFGNPITNAAGAVTLAVGSGSNWVQPFAILGRLPAPKPWVLIVGDSIAFGTVASSAPIYDTGDIDANIGWIERGLNSRFPLISCSRPGDRFQYWFLSGSGSTAMRYATLHDMVAQDPRMMAACTVIVEMGINDTVNSAATMLTYDQRIQQDLRGMGVKRMFRTILPPGSVTSTDNFTTVGNQTPGFYNPQRQILNNTYRASGYYGYDGIIDVAALLEDGGATSPSGVWAAPNSIAQTNDGTHINQATVAFAATAMTPIIPAITL